jgi:hypothetical protein
MCCFVVLLSGTGEFIFIRQSPLERRYPCSYTCRFLCVPDRSASISPSAQQSIKQNVSTMDQMFPFVLSDLSVDPHMTSPTTWHHNSITSFINNNKNEQPKESLHMIMLIIFPTKFRRSTCQIKYEFELTKTYSWSDINAH